MSNPDPYYLRPEVSNSDLTALKEMLHPRPQGDRERAFRMGNLVDALVTEPGRVNFYRMTVDGEAYTEEDFRFGREIQKALRAEAKRDRFLEGVLRLSDTQKVSVRHGQPFSYGPLSYTLDTRCKWDWWLHPLHYGGDLKTTSAASQKEFEDVYDFLDIDRSRAWYMDIENTERDFVYAISKKNFNVFKVFTERGDSRYLRGKGKVDELAFQWWCLNLN